jgi:hypothetical protein
MSEETKPTQEYETGMPDCETPESQDSSNWSSRARIEHLAEQMRAAGQGFMDGLLRMVPPEVVGHLNNSRKELLLAARTMIDKELESIDRCTQRAHSLHESSRPEEHEPEPSGTPKS